MGVGVAGLALAAVLSDAAGAFEVFLFLIGSVFVPLFGVFAADYFVLSRGRYGEAAMFERADASIRWRALVPWIVGFVVYQWCVPTGPSWWVDGLEHVVHDWLHLPFPLIGGSPLGASIPSFVVAFCSDADRRFGDGRRPRPSARASASAAARRPAARPPGPRTRS